MDMLALNPTGLLAKIFGQDARRPMPPSWVPPAEQGGTPGSPQGAMTWDWYRQQIEMSQERLDLYRDYEEMDQDDLIASILDAIAEDAAQTDWMTGKNIWVESDDPEIEKEGNAAFDRWNSQDNCAGICRESAKFGDDFEFLHQQRGVGIVAHEYIPPQLVWRHERQGRLSGFMLTDQPNPRMEDMMLPWQISHFVRRGGRRYPGVQYGDSWIRPARRIYRKLQMSEDAMVIYRLTKAPDKDVFYIDVGEAPPDEQVSILKMWRRFMKKNISYNAQDGILRGELNPLAYDESIFWPTKKDNGSKVERLPGSNNIGDIIDVEFLVNRLFAALRAPKDYFGFGESGAFDRGKALEQQDIRWARGIKAIQLAATRGYARMLEIHFALRGVDVTLPNHAFSVKMSPPSALDELQRADLYDARLRSMEGLTRLVADFQGLNKKAWYKFLLEKFGGFRHGFFEQFLEKAKQDGADMHGLEGQELTSQEKRFLTECYPRQLAGELHAIASNGTPSWDVRESLPRMAV